MFHASIVDVASLTRVVGINILYYDEKKFHIILVLVWLFMVILDDGNFVVFWYGHINA